MHQFRMKRQVAHSADNMFNLVAEVEDYPEFLPLCDALEVRSRETQAAGEIIVADMTVAYKLIRETFASRVTLKRPEKIILVEYLDGPFRFLENTWTFHDRGSRSCDVEFFIVYEFKSRALQMLTGRLFDRAFRRFSPMSRKSARAMTLMTLHCQRMRRQ